MVKKAGGNFKYEEPVSTEIVIAMNKIAKFAKANLPAGYGFILLFPQYGAAGVLCYMSSVPRKQSKEIMREYVEKIPDE